MYDNYTPLLEAATVDKIVVIYLSRYTYYLNIIFKQIDSTLIEYYITYIYIYISIILLLWYHTDQRSPKSHMNFLFTFILNSEHYHVCLMYQI